MIQSKVKIVVYYIVIIEVNFIVRWCNGNTLVFEAKIVGSSPTRTTNYHNDSLIVNNTIPQVNSSNAITCGITISTNTIRFGSPKISKRITILK